MSLIESSEYEALRPLNVVDYLRTHGWVPAVSTRSDVAVLDLPTPRGKVTTRVPLDDTFGDYGRRMAELADLLSRIEERPLAQIVNDLSTPPGDLVRFRLASEETESGSIGIADSLALRQALKNLMLASAHSAIAPASTFARLSQQRAVSLLAEIRERPSERGSYVASLFVPVSPPVGRLDIDEEFGRRTTRMLFSALAVAEGAAVNQDVLMSSAEQGVSSNFLEALAALEPSGARAALEVSVKWLGEAPAPSFKKSLRFVQGSFRHYRQVAKALRESSPLSNTEIEGYVIRVDRAPGAELGRVFVAAVVEGYGESRVQVPLSADQYQVATQAHMDGKRVRLVGTLSKAGRSLELKDHAGVEVLAAAD